LPEPTEGSRGKIHLTRGKNFCGAVGEAEMKMAGVVDLVGHALEPLPGGVDMQRTARLAPSGAEVLHDFVRGLGQTTGEGVQKSGEHLGSGDASARREAEGGGERLELAGKIGGLLGKIQAEAEDGQGEAAGPGNGFDQEAGQLPVFVEEVVRPFEGGFQIREGAHRVRGRERARERKKRELVCGRLQQDGAPKSQRAIGNPAVALAAAAGGLDFRGPDRGDLPGFSGQILGGAGFRDPMDAAAERVVGRKKGVDEGRIERVGKGRPGRLGLRGRNCRKS